MLNTTLLHHAARRVVALMLFAVPGVSAGCSAAIGQFVWAADYVAQTPSSASGTYLLGAGDLLSIQVFDNDKISTRGRVRADGKLAMPLLQDLEVAGKSPLQIAGEVEKRLRDGNLVVSPRVNVVVDEVPQVQITVIGAVSRAGNFAMNPGTGVAEALASAGGLTDYAHKDRIFVVRKLPKAVRIRFTFASLTDLGPAGTFRLQQGDIVVVE
jgi:polysaccharide biosynthesis/export protein